jgi:hypothetical protein
MKYLKPHIYLERIPRSEDFILCVLIYIDDNLKFSGTVGPVYDRTIAMGTSTGQKETVIEMFFLDAPGTINPDPMEVQFRLNKTDYKNDIRVRVDARHIHPKHHHDGTSSAHYGDPPGGN